MADLPINPTSLVPGQMSRDIYIQAKTWFGRLDPEKTKLKSYRDGISRAFGSLQIMGMSSPKPLQNLYVNLRALPELRKHRADASSLSEQNRQELEREIRKMQTRRRSDKIDEVVAELGYAGLFDDEDDELEIVHPRDRDTRASLRAADRVARKREKAIAGAGEERISARGVDAMSLVEECNHVAVLGGPGSGKTTFLKYLALAYCGFVPALAGSEPRLPLYVPLRELRRTEAPNPSATWLLNFIVACAGDLSKHTFSIEWLGGQLEQGNCLCLLDGIDELPPETIGTVMQSITSFAAKYPNNRVVATCRTAAFTRGLPGFKLCEVDDFDDQDIGKFAQHWFGDRDAERDRFIDDLRSSQASLDLCKSPLLLTLLCISYDMHRTLPRNRAELYERCVDALMWHWDTYRSVDRPVVSAEFSPTRKKLLLTRIARTTFDEETYLLPKGLLLRLLEDGMQSFGISRLAASDLLLELEANHGLIVERAIGIYCFSHLSFHEYFTAQSYCGDGAERDLLARALAYPRYREVFLMALEKMYSADDVVIGLAHYVKSHCIKPKLYDDYVAALIIDMRHVNMFLNPLLRRVLQELEIELELLSLEDEEDFDDEEEF